MAEIPFHYWDICPNCQIRVKFFFKAVKSHHARSKIVSITREDGSRIEDPNAIKEEAIKYFQRLLSENQPRPTLDYDLLGRALPRRLDNSQCGELAREVTNEEIKDAIFSMKDSKAPGPDGFNALLKKRAWNIVGSLVCAAVKSFFRSGRILREMNVTAISLIPKVPNPTMLKDFRPISCCNTIYKCIAKILANRLKVVIPHLVGKQQTAFVKGRRIGDNILLAQELLRNFHRDRGSPRCAIKVDLMKAYDTVKWEFLIAVLRTVGFPEIVIQWITECISTVKFSININGELCGFFAGEKGLRQGDPMSPYLFVLAMEVFSGLMNKMSTNKRFKFHWRCHREAAINWKVLTNSKDHSM